MGDFPAKQEQECLREAEHSLCVAASKRAVMPAGIAQSPVIRLQPCQSVQIPKEGMKPEITDIKKADKL